MQSAPSREAATEAGGGDPGDSAPGWARPGEDYGWDGDGRIIPNESYERPEAAEAAETADEREPDHEGVPEEEKPSPFDPIEGVRGSSIDLQAVLAFEWEDGTPYLSTNTSSVMKLATAVARADASEWEGKPLVRATHLLRALLLSTLLGEGGLFGGIVRDADEDGRFSRMIPAQDRNRVVALVQAASGEAIGHWEVVEILAAASDLRRKTNTDFLDIGQRHLFAAIFATGPGQTALRDLGGFSSGYEALRSSVLACLRAGEFSTYGDNADAWESIVSGLSAAPALVDRIERRPDYLNDRVTSGARFGKEPLGAAEDAQALADLILLEAAEPPIAVGLFGPWGSGKSTLIEHLKAEIVSQTDRERARRAAATEEKDPLRIVANVVQLSFNAWTFADSNNLWATFTSEIFDQLAAGGIATTDGGPAAAAKDLKTRAAAAALVSEVAARTAGEVASLRVADIAVQQQDRAIEVAEELLKKAQADRRVAFGDGVIDAARELGTKPDEIASALDLIRASYRFGWKQPLALLTTFLAVAAILYFAPTGALVPPEAVRWLSGLSIPFALLWPAIRAIFSAWRHWYVRRSAARRAVADAHAEVRRHIELRAAAERDRDRSKAFLSTYAMDEHGSAATSPMQMLDYLLKESKSVAAVRAQTGLLAVVRRCFEQLETVIANARGRSGAIDRIILYIDDLDRCSTGQVSEILQAVHLLLSFNCFIVVVAADANWLKHSLEHQHPQLFDDKSGRLTPADYLEKIFQIPFWVRPLVDADASEETKYAPYHLYVDYLLKDKEAAEPDVPEQSAAPEEKSADESAAPPPGGSFTAQPPNRKDDPATPRRERMALTADEQAFLKSLGALAAKSPRAVKRLINTYRLLRVRLDGRALESFLAGGDEDRAGYRAVLFAMACEVGLPPATMTLVGRTIMAMSPDEWNDFLARLQNPLEAAPTPAGVSVQADSAQSTEAAAELLLGALRSAKRLEDFKHAMPLGPPALTLRQLQVGLEEVRRYSFRPL